LEIIFQSFQVLVDLLKRRTRYSCCCTCRRNYGGSNFGKPWTRNLKKLPQLHLTAYQTGEFETEKACYRRFSRSARKKQIN